MCGRKPIFIEILYPKVKLFKTDGNTQWPLFNSTMWLIWKKSKPWCLQATCQTHDVWVLGLPAHPCLCNSFARTFFKRSEPAMGTQGWFWRVSLRHVWKTCHHLKGERKASSSARCIFHKLMRTEAREEVSWYHYYQDAGLKIRLRMGQSQIKVMGHHLC